MKKNAQDKDQDYRVPDFVSNGRSFYIIPALLTVLKSELDSATGRSSESKLCDLLGIERSDLQRYEANAVRIQQGVFSKIFGKKRTHPNGQTLLPKHIGCYITKDNVKKTGADETDNLSKIVFSSTAIHKLYQERSTIQKNKRWHVIVYSTDGFIEADNSKLLYTVENFARAGNLITYCFPFKEKQNNPHSANSLRNWRKIKTLLGAEPQFPQDNLRGFFIGAPNQLFHDKHNLNLPVRTVFFLSEKMEGTDVVASEIAETFLYQSLNQGVSDSTDWEVWLKCSAKLSEQLYENLKSSFMFRDEGSLKTNPNMAQLQYWYQTSFSDQKTGKINEHYDRTISLIESSDRALVEIAGEVIAEGITANSAFLEPTWGTVAKPLKYLDIGAGSRKETAGLIQSLSANINKRISNELPRLKIIANSIDSAQIRPDDVVADLDTLHVQTVPVSFEKYYSRTRYDLISFIHATYMIDHVYLKKAISMLSEDGLLAIITSPLKGNFINRLTCELDKLFLEFDEIFEKETTVARGQYEDPFRNYAEDTLAYLDALKVNSRLAAPRYKVLEIPAHLPRSKFFNNKNEMTELTWGLCELFGAGGKLQGIAKKFQGGELKLREYLSNELLNCDDIVGSDKLQTNSTIVTFSKDDFTVHGISHLSKKSFGIKQLTKLQSGPSLRTVWVYSNKPLEELNTTKHQGLAQQVCKNLLAGIKYVYFLENDADLRTISKVFDDFKNRFLCGDPKGYETVKSNASAVIINANIAPYGTFHFLKDGKIKIYQSLEQDNRDDKFLELTGSRKERFFQLVQSQHEAGKTIHISNLLD